MWLPWVTFIIMLWPTVTLQRSYDSSPTYVAGIVEYSPVLHSPDEENLGEANALNYVKIINKAVTYNVDILVFPESSLSISIADNATVRRSQGASYIPDPLDKVTPCDDKSEPYEISLRTISCAAKENQIYVLINHREKVDCTPGVGCPVDGFLIYNTNIAFDRKGEVIARYRKYNLFGEYDKNITEPIPTSFTTDFGVTFGTFTCFDLLFQTPALNLTHDLGITDILYPTHWFTQLPHLSSVETQAGWAYANDVNFLASSYNDPDTASGGAGIYLGKQGYVEVISTNKRSNILLVAEIPKVINGKRTQNINRDKVHIYEFSPEEIITGEKASRKKWFHLTEDLSDYTTELIDVKQRHYNKTICKGDFCCDFKVEVEFNETNTKNNSNYYRYRFAVSNGVRSFIGAITLGTQTCGIIACKDQTIDSCGQIFDEKTIAPTIFTSLKISTSIIINQNTLFIPLTLSFEMIPLNVTDFNFKYSNTEEYSMYDMVLTKPTYNLLTFTIGGRDYSKDGTEVTQGSRNKLHSTNLSLLITGI